MKRLNLQTDVIYSSSGYNAGLSNKRVYRCCTARIHHNILLCFGAVLKEYFLLKPASANRYKGGNGKKVEADVSG